MTRHKHPATGEDEMPSGKKGAVKNLRAAADQTAAAAAALGRNVVQQNKGTAAAAAVEGDISTDITDVAGRREMALQLAGAAKAFRLTSTTARVHELLAIQEVREHKGYEALGVTWSDYCSEYLGVARSTIDEDLQNLETLGPEFMERAEALSISRAAFRSLRRLPDGARPKLLASGVIEIAGERIRPDDRDALFEVIEELASRNNQLKDDKEKGTAQVDELRARVEEYEKQQKRVKGPRMDLPEGITEFDRLMSSLLFAVKDAIERINAEDPGTEPDRVLKWVHKLAPQWEEVTRYAIQWKPDPDVTPDGVTAEIEREIDEILGDD